MIMQHTIMYMENVSSHVSMYHTSAKESISGLTDRRQVRADDAPRGRAR